MLYITMSTNPSSLSQCTNGIGQPLPVDLAKHGVHLFSFSQRQKSRGNTTLIEQAAPGTVCDPFFPIFPPWKTFSVSERRSPISTTTSTCSSTTQGFTVRAARHQRWLSRDGCCYYFGSLAAHAALMGALTRSGHSRVVNVLLEQSNRALLTLPSDAHRHHTLFFAWLISNIWKIKLLNIMFNHHMAREHAMTNVTFTPSAQD